MLSSFRIPAASKASNRTRQHEREGLRIDPRRRLLMESLEDRRLLATLTVNSLGDDTLADDSLTTLREAISAANTDPDADTITFDADVFSGGVNSCLIRLTQGELVITESLTIDASSATDVVITGDANGDDTLIPGTFITDVAGSFSGEAGAADDLLDDNSRVLNFALRSTDRFANTGDLTLTGLTVTGGRTTGDNADFFDFTHSGGGVRFLSSGDLLLNSSTVRGNSTAGDHADGGGMFTAGSVSLTNSTVSGNSTTGERAGGGGIYMNDGGLILTSSTVSGNSTTGRKCLRRRHLRVLRQREFEKQHGQRQQHHGRKCRWRRHFHIRR